MRVDVSSGTVHAARNHRRYTIRVRARPAVGMVSIITVATTAAVAVDRIPVVAGGWGDHESLVPVDLPTDIVSTVWISAEGGALDVDWVALVDTGY